VAETFKSKMGYVIQDQALKEQLKNLNSSIEETDENIEEYLIEEMLSFEQK